jgi:hypothetical protein
MGTNLILSPKGQGEYSMVGARLRGIKSTMISESQLKVCMVKSKLIEPQPYSGDMVPSVESGLKRHHENYARPTKGGVEFKNHKAYPVFSSLLAIARQRANGEPNHTASSANKNLGYPKQANACRGTESPYYSKSYRNGLRQSSSWRNRHGYKLLVTGTKAPLIGRKGDSDPTDQELKEFNQC